MNRLIIIAGAGALVVAAGAVTLWAVQEPAVQTRATVTPGALDTAPAAGRSDRGAPDGAAQDGAAPDGAAQGRQEAFGDWLLVCPEAAGQTCSAVQRQVRSEDGRAIFAVSLRPAGEAGRQIVFLTPLGVLLEPGVELRIAGEPALSARFTHCQTGQCRAAAALDGAVEARLGAADQVSAAFRLAGGQEVDVPISVDGLLPAVDALDTAGGH